MTHPSETDWMAYLYRELPRADRLPLDQHLQTCHACRTRVAEWRKTMQGLQEWKVADNLPQIRAPQAPVVLKWAMAALLMLGTGYFWGRFSIKTHETERLRASLAASLRTELKADIARQVQTRLQTELSAALKDDPSEIETPLRREFKSTLEEWASRTAALPANEAQHLWASFLEAYQTDREQTQNLLLTIVHQTERKRQSEYNSLRQALETVAVSAADKIQRTEMELGELASYTQAKFTADPSHQFNENTQSTEHHPD